MPYGAGHKARTRARIVDSARRLFNRCGFEQVSIDQIMAGTGLTRGGFYSHFASKDSLYAEAVASYAACNPFATKMATTRVYRSALAGVRDGNRRAHAIVSLCVGGMVLARTTNDDALRRALRTAARHQALALLDA